MASSSHCTALGGATVGFLSGSGGGRYLGIRKGQLILGQGLWIMVAGGRTGGSIPYVLQGNFLTVRHIFNSLSYAILARLYSPYLTLF